MFKDILLFIYIEFLWISNFYFENLEHHCCHINVFYKSMFETCIYIRYQ